MKDEELVPDYALFDADNHFYEPRDSFTRFIDPAYAERAVRPVILDDGREVVYAADREVTYLARNIFDEVGRPGSLKELLHSLKSGVSGADEYEWEKIRPEYRDREARLATMRRQGIEGMLLFPSIAVVAEHFLSRTDDLYANLHAFNRYLDEDWGFAFKDQLYAVPLLSLKDLDLAVKELEWVLDRGAKVISLRPGPAYGRSLGDPFFDPFWARVDEAAVAVAFHLADSGYNERISVDWGWEPNPPNFEMSAWQWMNCDGDRPIMDSLSALVYDNLFGRYPNVRAVSVENGCEWFPYFVRRLDKMRGMGRNGPWIGGPLPERPSEIVKRHIFVTPYPEDDIVSVAAAVGTDSLVFGSDWPHAEGVGEPADYAEALRSLSSADQRKIMRGNGLRLIGRPDL